MSEEKKNLNHIIAWCYHPFSSNRYQFLLVQLKKSEIVGLLSGVWWETQHLAHFLLKSEAVQQCLSSQRAETSVSQTSTVRRSLARGGLLGGAASKKPNKNGHGDGSTCRAAQDLGCRGTAAGECEHGTSGCSRRPAGERCNNESLQARVKPGGGSSLELTLPWRQRLLTANTDLI